MKIDTFVDQHIKKHHMQFAFKFLTVFWYFLRSDTFFDELHSPHWLAWRGQDAIAGRRTGHRSATRVQTIAIMDSI